MKKIAVNKKYRGVARILVYPENRKYIAVCLDFDIIEEADSKNEVIKQIDEATRGYIENVIKNNLDEKLLNRHAPEKYWKIYREYNEYINLKDSKGKVTPKIRNSWFKSSPIDDFVKNGEVFA